MGRKLSLVAQCPNREPVALSGIVDDDLRQVQQDEDALSLRIGPVRSEALIGCRKDHRPVATMIQQDALS